jgi:hypothetical protein
MLQPSTVTLSLLLAVSLTHPASAACERGTRPAIHVVAEPTPVTVAADFSLSELSDLAHRAGGSEEHAPLGFYTSTVQQMVNVELGSGPAAACTASLRIELNIQLASRRIEIGREMQRQGCRYSAVLRHYQKKAAADSVVFARYVSVITSTLGTTPVPHVQMDGDDAGAVSGRQQLVQWVQDIVQQSLPSLQKARREAFQAVDTTDEMRQLAEACSQGA